VHEAAITDALLAQVCAVAPEGARVVAVRIEVGELEHLDSLVMETVWAAMTLGTRVEGARLDSERVLLRVRCGACGEEYQPEDPAILLCLECGAVRPEILAGSGVLLRSVEVEEPGES